MTRYSLFRSVAILSISVGFSGCQTAPPPPETRAAPAAEAKPDPVARGKYLAAAGACGDCHTPFKMGPNGPEPDMERELSGHPESLKVTPVPALKMPWMLAGTATNTAYAGPWGVSFAANLTSDADTGMGVWTEEMFVKAMRTGRHFGTSRPVLPPMPWQSYSQLTDEDLKAIFAYLRTVKPVKNHVPEPIEPPEPAGAAAKP
jgi:mono/diheme cytochrome c family protein